MFGFILNYTRRNRLAKSRGFSVVELLIALVIVSVIAGIAIPIYLNIKTREYLHVAQKDGQSLSGEVQAVLSSYQDFGSTDGVITWDSTTKLMSITLGNGATSPTPVTETLTKGTTVSGKTFASSTSWCIDVANNGQHAIFTETGYAAGMTTCPLSGFYYPSNTFTTGSDNQQLAPVGPFGGSGTKTYAITSGSLPPGVTFDTSTGVFSGPISTAWNFTAKMIASGGDYSCAVTSLAGVKCWGNNTYGQVGDNSTVNRSSPTDVYGLTSGVNSVYAGAGGTTCALLLTGALQCWGYNGEGQVGDGTTTNRYSPVDVTGLGSGVSNQIGIGLNSVCAVLNNGMLKCWGNNTNGQLGNGTTTNSSTPTLVSGFLSGASRISVGGSTACVINTSRALYCWGLSTDGQMGTGSTTKSLTPTPLPSMTSGVTQVSLGLRSACAIILGGAVKCWGYNGNGELGINSTTGTNTPVALPTLTTSVQQIDMGGYGGCAVTGTNGAKCWGLNTNGQVGDGTVITRLVPTDVTGLTSGVSQIGSGTSHACAITTALTVQCWGLDTSGQLADGIVTQRTTAQIVTNLIVGNGNVPAFNQTCALTTAGGIVCWGNNGKGQLGNGNKNNQSTPVDVVGLTTGVMQVAAGRDFTCAVTTGNKAKCWGSNQLGQLGTGGTTDSLTAVDVNGLTGNTKAVAAGDGFACAIQSQSNGNVWCWGDNTYGELGNGTTTSSLVPVQVTGLGANVNAIAAGFGPTACALLSTGNLKCWGYNSNGQVGDGTTTNRLVPTDVSGMTSGVTSFDVGPNSACAVISTGAAKCWGYNGNGQIGNGTTTQSLVPTQVTGLTSGVTQIAVGYYHACAVINTGVKCWGNNLYGQVGDGTTTSRLSPVDAAGMTTGVQLVATGQYHTCVVMVIDTAYCWGLDTSGQLGLGTLTQEVTAVPSNYTGAQAGFPTTLVVTVTDSSGSTSTSVTLSVG